MKQETNNEMDLLLRRLARRQDVFAPAAEDHLDADELSAYAENALPAKTRVRYTEHLAECSRCRELVVQLSASAGVVIAEQAGKVSGLSGWRKFLASLISPMVLRYAAPALGLIVVAAIGLVVLRRDKAGDYVSQVQNEQAQPAGAARVAEPAEPGQSPAVMYDNQSKSPADSTANKEATKDSPQQPASPAPAATPEAVAQNAAPVKTAEPKPESQPAAAEPPPAPAAKLETATVEKRQNEDAARKQEAEVKVAAADESKKSFEFEVKGRGDGPATARARAAKNKSESRDLSGAATGAIAPQSPPREDAGKDDQDSSAETRSVAGRRFRKQRGIWVDTAYDSSSATTTYSRNSESYRSLIADEPAIKTIADQLDGEIIVVWKGRTYRIR